MALRNCSKIFPDICVKHVSQRNALSPFSLRIPATYIFPFQSCASKRYGRARIYLKLNILISGSPAGFFLFLSASIQKKTVRSNKLFRSKGYSLYNQTSHFNKFVFIDTCTLLSRHILDFKGAFPFVRSTPEFKCKTLFNSCRVYTVKNNPSFVCICGKLFFETQNKFCLFQMNADIHNSRRSQKMQKLVSHF